MEVKGHLNDTETLNANNFRRITFWFLFESLVIPLSMSILQYMPLKVVLSAAVFQKKNPQSSEPCSLSIEKCLCLSPLSTGREASSDQSVLHFHTINMGAVLSWWKVGY